MTIHSGRLSKEGTPAPLESFIFWKEQQASHFLKCPPICFLFVLMISIGIMEKQKTNQSRSLGTVKPAQPWALLYTKGNFRWGSKVQGPMNSSNVIGWKILIGPKAFRGRLRTKKWQIEPKPPWHLLWREINWLGQKTVLKRELLIWRTKNKARDHGTAQLQLQDSICFKSVQIGS